MPVFVFLDFSVTIILKAAQEISVWSFENFSDLLV